jgi:hypothetical protein
MEQPLHRRPQCGEHSGAAFGVEFGVQVMHPIRRDPVPQMGPGPLRREHAGRVDLHQLADLTLQRPLQLLRGRRRRLPGQPGGGAEQLLTHRLRRLRNHPRHRIHMRDPGGAGLHHRSQLRDGTQQLGPFHRGSRPAIGPGTMLTLEPAAIHPTTRPGQTLRPPGQRRIHALQPAAHPHQPPTRLTQPGLTQHIGIERQQLPNSVPNRVLDRVLDRVSDCVVPPASHDDILSNTRS